MARTEFERQQPALIYALSLKIRYSIINDTNITGSSGWFLCILSCIMKLTDRPDGGAFMDKQTVYCPMLKKKSQATYAGTSHSRQKAASAGRLWQKPLPGMRHAKFVQTAATLIGTAETIWKRRRSRVGTSSDFFSYQIKKGMAAQAAMPFSASRRPWLIVTPFRDVKNTAQTDR